MSAGALSALNTKPLPLHNPCYLGISPMAHGRRLLLTTSPMRVKSTCSSVIFLASTPSSIKCHLSLPIPYLCLQELISQYGPPCLICIDNGHVFASNEFSQVLQHSHIDHITSFPHFPRSNGFTEQQVRTINTALSTTH